MKLRIVFFRVFLIYVLLVRFSRTGCHRVEGTRQSNKVKKGVKSFCKVKKAGLKTKGLPGIAKIATRAQWVFSQEMELPPGAPPAIWVIFLVTNTLYIIYKHKYELEYITWCRIPREYPEIPAAALSGRIVSRETL
jgi:hypothetical protein